MLSIVIASYNCLELTQKCLDSLIRTLDDYKYEIIIVDDCSTDGTRSFLRSLPSNYRVILNEEKGNFAKNSNAGAALARFDTICFLNNDTEVESGWLEPMLSVMNRFTDAGCVGNVQKIPATNRYDHFGICFPKWLTPQHYGQHLKERPSDIRGEASRWAAITAACLIIKKSLFESIGGFDENYVNGCEDIDLCLRLHAKGYWHYVAHQSEIAHHKGSSPGRKDHNDQNLLALKATHATYIKTQLLRRDAHLAAKACLASFLAAPARMSPRKLLRATLSYLTTAKPPSLARPECFTC